MSTPECVERDERTVAVENASYRWAYLLLTYALLVDAMCRSLVRHEASWDLMATDAWLPADEDTPQTQRGFDLEPAGCPFARQIAAGQMLGLNPFLTLPYRLPEEQAAVARSIFS